MPWKVHSCVMAVWSVAAGRENLLGSVSLFPGHLSVEQSQESIARRGVGNPLPQKSLPEATSQEVKATEMTWEVSVQ